MVLLVDVLVVVEPVVVEDVELVVVVEPVVVEVVDCVVVEVVDGVVVVDVVDGVVVVVVDVVPPLGHRLASWLCGPGVDGPSRMSPSCLLWPLFQPLMLIEITTKGFVAEPVLWQTSTFWPAVEDWFADDLFECFVWTDECVELDTLACECAFACPFAFPWPEAAVPDDAVFKCFCFVWPGAFAELPCVTCCAACFFCWPGAFPELPWPFPATALPLNAIAATATASTPPRPRLGRCIASPVGCGTALEGRPTRLVHGTIRI